MLSPSPLLCSLLLIGAATVASAKDHQHHHPSSPSSSDKGHTNDQTSLLVELNEHVQYNLTWCADFDQQEVKFEVNFLKNDKSGGDDWWYMFGFSDHGKEAGSDFCLFNNGGNQDLIDGHLNDDLEPIADTQQDCQLLLNDYENGRIVFKRKFTTCDIRDYAVEPGTTQFLLATGRGTLKSLKAKDVSKHFRYNMLLQYPVHFPAIEESHELVIRAANANVPAVRTTYWCAIVDLTKENPDLLDTKHHVVKLEPIITPGNEQIVHHMEVFHCVTDEDAKEEFNGNCQSEERPKMSHMCSKVLAAWSMGAAAVSYPKEAGLPFGGKGFRPFVMVEIHYNNEAEKAGIVDNSGFRFTYTKKLRPHDAGIIELGHIYSDANSIPPKEKAFPLTSYCVSDCTEKFPKDGITIFGTQLHAHETGRKLWTSHFRNGVKIGEINRDNHYTHHWQHIMALQKPIKVLPGDVLTTTCVYDTADKDHFVFGGYEISNEMCVNYIYYYPVSDVEVCKSAVDNSTLRAWFKKHGVNASPKTPFNEMYDVLAGNWNAEMSKELLELYTTSNINMACLDHSGQLFKGHPTNWEKVEIPKTFAGVFEKKRAFDECPAIND